METRHESKTRLLNAALHVIRAKGYAATTVEDICHKAGVTKGSFFHHFRSKDELALAAASYWGSMTDGFFAAAPYRKLQDPLDRLLGYVDFRASILNGELPDYTCLLGTLVQETYATHSEIRAACERGLSSHIAELTRDIAAAKKLYAPKARWSPEERWVFHSNRAAGLVHLCQGTTKPGCRARKSESLAPLSGRSVQSIEKQVKTQGSPT